MKELSIIITIVLASTLLLAQTTGTMTDPRDGQTYKTIKIGKQEWMAENMNIQNPNSWCYNNDPTMCEEFGSLYSYVGAAHACPAGWHMPASKDWDKLIEEIGKERSAIELREDGNTGFNALLAGVRYDHGGFNHLNENAYFWSHVSAGDETAWVYLINRSMLSVSRIHSFSGNGFSVRCIRR